MSKQRKRDIKMAGLYIEQGRKTERKEWLAAISKLESTYKRGEWGVNTEEKQILALNVLSALKKMRSADSSADGAEGG